MSDVIVGVFIGAVLTILAALILVDIQSNMAKQAACLEKGGAWVARQCLKVEKIQVDN